MTFASPPSVYLERPPIAATLEAMASAIDTGSRSSVASEWTADAARDSGGSKDPLTVARFLADRIRATVTYAADTYGAEVVQHVEETLLGRRAGDCDDFAVAFCSLARRAGMRTGLSVYYVDDVPVHVVPVVEDPKQEGRWIPFELTERVSFGTYPAMRAAGSWQVTAVDGSSFPGLGFIDSIIGGVLSIFAGDKQVKAAKANAAGVVNAEKVRADAARSVAQTELLRDREAAAAAAYVARTNATAQVVTVTKLADLVRAALPFVLGVAVVSAAGGVASAARAPKRRAR